MGWDVTYQNNFIKQFEYMSEISLPKYNTGGEYYFMDVFESLILIMIIRREIINFAIRTKHYELLGITSPEQVFMYDLKTIMTNEEF
jgi:pantothenate kinase